MCLVFDAVVLMLGWLYIITGPLFERCMHSLNSSHSERLGVKCLLTPTELGTWYFHLEISASNMEDHQLTVLSTGVFVATREPAHHIPLVWL